MMAYNDKFVLAILHNGAPVREVGGKIHLPFHSDYKVRVKNKDPLLRAKVRIWIDGRQVSNLGDFILQPNETLDLERFLDESMTEGRKFKFVPLGDSRVNDPTDEENGIIKVEFYRELQKPQSPISPCRKGFAPQRTLTDWFYNPSTTLGGNHIFTETSCAFTSSNYVATNLVAESLVPENAGATVEGGHSEQSFGYGSDFQTELFPVTLELRIRGIDQNVMDWEDRPNIPRKQKKRIKFCPNCGTKRHGMAKFCASCGTAYHQRYERERGRIVG